MNKQDCCFIRIRSLWFNLAFTGVPSCFEVITSGSRHEYPLKLSDVENVI
jgi:hypothetical protein